MSVLFIPTEILLQIATQITCIHTLHALALGNHRFHALFDPILYQQDARDGLLTAIRWASEHGKIKLIKKSLSHGARIPPHQTYPTFSEGKSRLVHGRMSSYYFEDYPSHPLCVAVENRHADIVHLLVALGGSIDMRNSQWQPLLSLAVIHGHPDMVRTLLHLGAPQDRDQYFNRNSPIQIAAFRGDEEIVRILLQHHNRNSNNNSSPHPNRPTAQQMQSALECALLQHHLHLVAPLLHSDPGVNLEFYFDFPQPYPRCTPLIWAVEEGQLELAQLLLRNGVDPNRPYGWDKPPLLRAVAKGHEDMIRLLTPITHRIQVTRALSLSIMHIPHPDELSAQILLENGAKPEFEKGDEAALTQHHSNQCLLGWTVELVPPLICAVSRGCISLVRLLVEHGADVNVGYDGRSLDDVPDWDEGGPLLLAMKMGNNEDIVRFLRGRGADEEAGKVRGRRAAELAEQFVGWSYTRPGAG
ncbi:ankyrin repeat-containing domain protein [Aspergillus cavernicola]|uniref:Ankyrin repeat-containing domain protein n=1 Tax=Aspergillus cavernicola TaxID=176166 RepID=A0ABR4J5N7_9EURO